jgi:hypothetical protein
MSRHRDELDARIARAIREGDPGKDARLPGDEVARLRARLKETPAARGDRARLALRAVLAAAAAGLALLAVLPLGRGPEPGAAARVTGGALAEQTSREQPERLQLQMVAPGGTRIYWTLVTERSEDQGRKT